MSYSGTVRCSHCYRQGHNRRKCEHLNDVIKSKYEANVKACAEYRDNTSERAQNMSEEDRTWYVEFYAGKAEAHRQEYLKRTKIDLATGKKVTNKAAKAQRMKNVTCGYCGRMGHTRRTCQNVKNDYAIFLERNRVVRQNWLEDAKAAGIGIGTMVIKDTYGYNSKGEYGKVKVAGLITSIDWERIGAHSSGDCFVIESNSSISGKTIRYGEHFNNATLEVLTSKFSDNAGCVMPSGAVPSPPANWLSGAPSIKDVFDTKEKRPWNYKHSLDRWQTVIREQLGLPLDAYWNG